MIRKLVRWWGGGKRRGPYDRWKFERALVDVGNRNRSWAVEYTRLVHSTAAPTFV